MIVSLFLENHDYLINQPQTINFGGRYLYSFSVLTDNFVIITRELNKKFIPNFFNISDSPVQIKLMSTIVGENGAGKSTILDIIRETFAKSDKSASFIILSEQDGETKILYNNIGNVMIVDNGSEVLSDERKHKRLFPDKIDIGDYQSIYYSPHFDLKYPINKEKFDDFDISLDTYIASDLEDISNKGTNQHGVEYPAHIELLFRNTIRQVEFLNSNLFKKQEILDLFKIPKYDTATLYFRTMKKDEEFWNTPMQFRKAIISVNQKLDQEIEDWADKVRKMDGRKVLNQLEINKYLVKRFYIKSLLEIIKRRFEERNTFLEEGYIADSSFLDANLDGEEMFKEFIDQAYIKYAGSHRKIFDSSTFSDFTAEVNFLVDKIIDVEKVENFSIEVKINDLKQVLELQRKIITELLNYYPHREYGYDKNPNFYEFLSLRPLNKNLSSGENAFLNFFSKLYDFINTNLTKERSLLTTPNNFILLLDEADLGFHPQWKKQFVFNLLKTLPLFFESLTPVPDIQIIFTTHDALTLSDMPSRNVSYLSHDGNYCSILDDDGNDNLQKTFGANIIDLLSDSFFISESLVGDFAEKKIQETIDWIVENTEAKQYRKNTETFKQELEYHRSVIRIIDEKITKLKLAEMINDVYPDNEYHNSIVESEIEYLRKKLLP